MIEFSFLEMERLLELAKRKKALVEEFYELTTKQGELIASDDLDSLNQNLNARDVIIEKISVLQREYTPLYESFNQSKERLPKGELDEALPRIDAEITELLKKAGELDAKNAESGRGFLEGLGQKARDAGQKRKTVGAYKLGGNEHTGYFDKLQ